MCQAEFAERVRAVSGSPPRTASLTFDDGAEDNATLLPSLLEELEVPATLFVNSGLLGQPYRFLDASTGVRVMDDAQLQAVARHPLIEIGSHTRTHVLLGDATEEQALAGWRATSESWRTGWRSRSARSRIPNVSTRPPAQPRPSARVSPMRSLAAAGAAGRLTSCLARVRRPATGAAFELKARGHFHRVRSLPPVKVARWATRRRRYGT